MLISSETGSGLIVSAREETRFYDDIACLAADWPAHRDNAIAWVRIADGRWIQVQAASYIRRPDSQTAMGSGLTAFATINDATLADRSGPVLTFDEVVQGAEVRQ